MTKRVVMSLLLAVVLLAGSATGAAGPTARGAPDAGAAAIPAGVFSQYGGTGCAIAVQGEYAYVGMGPRVLTFRLDGTNAPTYLGRSELLPGIARRIVVAGGYAYVAAEKGGLAVLSLADPAHPVLAGVCDTPGTAMGVAVLPGNRVAVADADGGLRIVAVDDPAHPAEVGHLATRAPAQAVCTTGNTIYLAIAGPQQYGRWFGSSLEVVDATDPALPVSIGYCEVREGLATSIAVSGTTVYIGSEQDPMASYPTMNGGVRSFDVSDPAAPVHGSWDRGMVYDVAIAGNRLYAADMTRTVVYEITGPLSWPWSAENATHRGARALAASAGGALYAVRSNDLLVEAMSASDPGVLEVLQSVPLPGYASHTQVAMRHGRGYAAGSMDLEVLDLSPGSGAVSLSRIAPGPVSINDVAVGERYAYVTQTGGPAAYTYVIDISNPTNAVLAGQVGDHSYHAALQGNYLYTLRTDRELEVWDLTNPALPQKVGALDDFYYATEPTGQRLAVQGDYAYIAGGSEVWVIDVSDPSNPVQAAAYAGDNWDYIGIDVAGDRAYATQSRGIVHDPKPDAVCVLDISDPANIVELGRVELPDTPWVARPRGDLLYVANGDYGAQVIDASDPANPTVIATYPLAGHCSDVAVDGAGRVLAACGDAGVYVITPELTYSTFLPVIARP